MSQIERRALLGAVGLIGAATVASLAHAGSLNPPPGPVTPTMKPLTDVEPRTAVQSLTGDGASLYVISQPGSYYLTGPITGVSGKNGIFIAVANVTLDLCGFPLLGVAGSLSGVASANPNGNLVVRNGIVRAWGGNGVDLSNNFDSIVCELLAANNTGTGIAVGDASVVRDCVSRDNGLDCITTGTNCSVNRCNAIGSVNGNGLYVGPKSQVGDCCANYNKLDGIGGTIDLVIARCAASQNGKNGIETGDRSRVLDCGATQNGNIGISVGSNCAVKGCVASNNLGASASASFAAGVSCVHGCIVSECAASENTGNGIAVDYGSTVTGCSAQSNTGHGYVSYSGCVISGNTAFSNGADGIRAGGTSLVERNTASFNGQSTAGAAGIHSTIGRSRIIGNHCIGNIGTGILSDTFSVDYTVGNSAVNNTVANYNPSSGAPFGPVTAANSASATAWVNF